MAEHFSAKVNAKFKESAIYFLLHFQLDLHYRQNLLYFCPSQVNNRNVPLWIWFMVCVRARAQHTHVSMPMNIHTLPMFDCNFS